MKVTFLTLDYPPNRFVGAEIAVHRFAKFLAARGHDVMIRCVEAKRAAHYDGFRTWLDRTTTRDQPDWAISTAGLATRTAMFYRSSRRAVWAHNNQISAMLDIREASPDLLIANSQHQRDVFLSTLGFDGVMVMYPLPARGVKRLARRGKAITLVNGSADKGGDVLREVARLLPEKQFLVVAGGHGKQGDFSGLANVEVVPGGPNLEPVWRRTGTLLVPSRLESYSMVGFEALQHGIPVVARALPGVMEALGRFEHYVPSLDPDEWASHLVLSPSKQALSAAATGRAIHVDDRYVQVDAQMEAVAKRLEEAS